jgi:hypothetical protein
LQVFYARLSSIFYFLYKTSAAAAAAVDRSINQLSRSKGTTKTLHRQGRTTKPSPSFVQGPPQEREVLQTTNELGID